MLKVIWFQILNCLFLFLSTYYLFNKSKITYFSIFLTYFLMFGFFSILKVIYFLKIFNKNKILKKLNTLILNTIKYYLKLNIKKQTPPYTDFILFQLGCYFLIYKKTIFFL